MAYLDVQQILKKCFDATNNALRVLILGRRYTLSAVKATTYQALVTDDLIRCSTAGGAFTVTLPAAASAGAGFELTLKDVVGNCGTANLTIDGSGAETIDGAATIAIATNYGKATVVCDGTNWFTI